MAASDLAGPFAAAIRGSLASGCGSSPSSCVAPVLPCSATGGWCSRRPAHWPARRGRCCPGSPAGRSRSRRRRPAGWRCAVRRAPAARVGLVAGPDVARGEEEVTRAAAAWPGATVLPGDDAAAAGVAALAAEVDVLHLAGHGRHPGENPLFSAVELVDGPWFGYDIDQLPRTPTWWCCPRASSAGSRCARARRRSG